MAVWAFGTKLNFIKPGRYKAIYGNMPVFGLTAATKHVPAMGRKETARRPLGGDGEPAVS